MNKIKAILAFLFLPISIFAYNFELDSIYYNILSEEDRTVETTYLSDFRNNADTYEGEIEIPKKLIYNSKTYTVTAIGDKTFYYCSKLNSVSIPNSVTSIGNNAFSSCWGLTSVSIPNSVTSIGNSAFRDCRRLTSVSIPNSVTLIGDHAFEDCRGLTSVPIPNSVTSIGDYAFSSCRLTSVSIPNSVTSIGSCAFSGCGCLTSVSIPNSVTSIGRRAFSGCSGLTSVSIPNSVTSIGSCAFSGCTNLSEIAVDANNYKYCSTNGILYSKDKTELIRVPAGYKTSFVSIPNSVTSIGVYAFEECSGLTSVSIPNSVTSIGDYAFSGCTNLQYIYCMPTTPPNSGSFSDENYKNTTLYVPVGSLSAYEKVDPWRNFWNIEEYDFSGVVDITIDDYSNCPVEIYNLSGNKVGSSKESLSPGIYIMRQGRKVEKIMIQ